MVAVPGPEGVSAGDGALSGAGVTAATAVSLVATRFAFLRAAAVVVEVRGRAVRRAVFSVVVGITSFLSLPGTIPYSTRAQVFVRTRNISFVYTRYAGKQ
jgi:hypothetical protein